MKQMKVNLEKATIYKYKYGHYSPEKPFKVKELLIRNSSNHMLKNKKAVQSTTPKKSTKSPKIPKVQKVQKMAKMAKMASVVVLKKKKETI
mmetsp:Transcript_10993/g.14865  ORF Transcript_10993/g.14865 Transcript_10993/m.14865 type:complete len:91 (+) Transcript_10993:134-406(+)